MSDEPNAADAAKIKTVWKPPAARSCGRLPRWGPTRGAGGSMIALIGDIRARQGEIRYVRELGGPIEVPDRETQPDLDFRGWMQDQGKGEWSGPKVRAAGRIVLQRDAGKLMFIDIRDWTGQIQLLVGKEQVGEENWALAECFDLGDIIGVDGELSLHQDRRADDLRRQAAFPHQDVAAAARKARGPDRSRAAAADAVSRSGLWRRRAASGF